MALRNRSARNSFQLLLALVLVWGLVVYAYEFKVLQRPALAEAGRPKTDGTPAPAFGLTDVTFACAAQRGFVTSVQLAQSGLLKVSEARCESGFNEATTRCPSLLPMSGYGDQIKCAQPEAIHCHGGPLQTVGLFKDDSFCGDVSDRDLGPPEEAPRTDD